MFIISDIDPQFQRSTWPKLRMQLMSSAFSWRTDSLLLMCSPEHSSGRWRFPRRILHQLRLALSFLREKTGQLWNREVIVLPTSEVNPRWNLENQDSDIRRDTTTIKLVWVKFLRELDQRQPSVFTRVVNISRAGHGIKRQQVRGRFVLFEERHIINVPLVLRERRP